MVEYLCVMCRNLISLSDINEIKTGENASFYLCPICRPKWEIGNNQSKPQQEVK